MGGNTMSKRTWRAIALFLLSSVPAWAALNGDIEGVVKDATGAVIPSANVTITSVETGVQRTLVSNERGYFIATLLPIGEYDVRVEFAGFKANVQRVLVKSAERASLNITLEVGPVTDFSTVETAVQLVNTTDAQLSVSIEEKRVKELPLATRDPLVLATLSPGVVPVTAANPFLGNGSFNANGGRGRGNNITIDNVVSTDVSTAGGAVIRERMLSFGHYEGLQIRGAGGTRRPRVPTAAQRAAVTDPTSKAILAEAGLPAAETDDPSSGFGLVSQVAPVSTENNAWSARIDRNFGGGRDLLTGRYAMQKSEANSEGNTFINTNLAGYGASSQNKPQNFSLGWTHLLGARMVNEARFAFGRSKPNFFPQST